MRSFIIGCVVAFGFVAVFFLPIQGRPVPIGEIEIPEIPLNHKFRKSKIDKSGSIISKAETKLNCGPVPASLRSPPYSLDPFYQQYCDADGIPVLASSDVNPEALKIGAMRMSVMTQRLAPAVKWAMIDSQTRIAILGKNEVVTDIPEKSDLYEVNPHRDWDKRVRGLGPTKTRPVAVTGEENVLCLKGNRLPGSDTFVHEFAHAVHYMGLREADPGFEPQLKSAYEDAVKKRGLWKGTYASKNYIEYWAVAVQIWFDVNYSKRGYHENYINTKEQLVYYDPILYNLVAKYMPATSIKICPNSFSKVQHTPPEPM